LKALYALIFEARTTLDTVKLPEDRAARAIELLTAALALADDLMETKPTAVLSGGRLKDSATVLRDANDARGLIGEAKALLSDARVPINKRLSAKQSGDAWFLLDKADARLDGLMTYVSLSPAEMGRKGGAKTAQRGPEYFAKIAAMRKTKAGGRPKKSV
jgi:hypothetical protein